MVHKGRSYHLKIAGLWRSLEPVIERREAGNMQGSAGASAAAAPTQAKKRITTIWFFTMVLIFCSIFVAIATAASNDCEKQYCSKSKGFAAVWNIIIACIIMYYGTRTFRYAKVPYDLGLLIGVLFVMSYNLFMQFILFVGLAQDAKKSGHEPHADNAAAAFAFFLFVAYGALTIMIYRAKDEILGTSAQAPVIGQAATSGVAQSAVPPPVNERAVELAQHVGTA